MPRAVMPSPMAFCLALCLGLLLCAPGLALARNVLLTNPRENLAGLQQHQHGDDIGNQGDISRRRSLLQFNFFGQSSSPELFFGDNQITPFVRNGAPVSIGQKRYMASLRRSWNGRHFCGGALIHPNWVLTAAHCLDLVDTDPKVHLNRRKRTQTSQPNSEVDVFSVKRVVKHPRWNGDLRDGFDIALIELEGRSNLPILNLPPRALDLSAVGKLEVVGWGETETGFLAEDLLHADVDVFNRQVCNSPSLFGPFIKDSMFCAGGRGRDSCVGDSGGPIVDIGADGKEYAAGVTSFGKSGVCGEMNTPTVYTFINPYLAWIRQVTGINAPSAPPPRPNPSPSPRPARPSSSPSPSPQPARPSSRPSLRPSPSKPLDSSWWRADILNMLGSPSSPASSPPASPIKDKCNEGGMNWAPDQNANGCQWCNAYAGSMTKATCIDCCCSSGDRSKQFTYAGCPGLRSSQSSANKMDWSSWEWNPVAGDSVPSGNQGSTSSTWWNNNKQPTYSNYYGR